MLTINVLPYDPTWPAAFEKIEAQLQSILSHVPLISIEHVGSTSVPSLPSKPIIDIDIVVSPAHFPAAAHALGKNGHTYNPEPAYMDRLSFRYDAHAHDPGASRPTEDGKIRRAVYLVMPISEQLRNHLIVREVLRRDDGLRAEYGTLKLDLARKGHESIGHYAGAKGDMIKRILEMRRKNKDIVARVEEIIRE
jgi:GrpB-like predicted nucleotidyltransferase (UPF0157 family)